ncbi:MAG: ribosomal protein S18-alanine N-acetyltransferase [Chloroflexota bacterium]
MTYYIDQMRQEDIHDVSRVERMCFTNPWPQSAYRRELRKPQSNYYAVLRKGDPRRGRSRREGESDRSWRSRLLAFNRRDDNGHRDPVVGFAGMWIMFDEAHVTTIGIHPDHRGRGLGELMLSHLLTEAMERGAELMTLEVRVSNESAQSLYRKYGFSQQGVRRNYYSDDGEDAYIMWSPRMREPEYVRHFHELRRALYERLEGEVILPGQTQREVSRE